MRKETLYEIYDSVDDVMLITNNLEKLSRLSNKTGDIFLSFCKNNLVDRRSIRNILNLCSDIEYSLLGYETDSVVNSINEVLIDDYVMNDTDYHYLMDNYSILLQNSVDYLFYVEDEEELAYYKALTILEFNRFLKNFKNYDMSKIYTHDLCEIIDTYNNVLEDLPNTKSNNPNIDYNEILVKRLQYFIDIISDKAIYELDDAKYKEVLYVASKTANIEDLKLLKNTIKLNRTLNNNDFKHIVDSDDSDFNNVTIDLIYDALGVNKLKLKRPKKTILLRNFYDEEKEREIIKKVLKPENNA